MKGAYASRKLWFSASGVLACLVAGAKMPSASVEPVVTGIVMIVGLYVTGNVGAKWTVTRGPQNGSGGGKVEE